MTSPTSANTNRRDGGRGERGFTLIELLVVISIILVLAGILLPALSRAWKQAQRTAMANDLQAIGTALDAYKKDFGDIPRVRADLAGGVPVPQTDQLRPNPMTGAQVLCTSLLGLMPAVEVGAPGPPQRPIQDGADGPGFRVRPGGKIYPPYLPLDRFRAGDPSDPFAVNTDATTNGQRFCLLDGNEEPILYFPASLSRPNLAGAVDNDPIAPGLQGPYVDRSEKSLWDADDNLMWFTNIPRDHVATATLPAPDAEIALKRIRALMGDRSNSANLTLPGTPDGVVQPYESAVQNLPYVLWAAGPDERFGPEAFSGGPTLNDQDIRSIERNDDVTNFR